MDATEVVQRKPALLSHRRAKKGIRRGMLGMTKRRNVADWLECPDYLWTRGVERMEEGNILLLWRLLRVRCRLAILIGIIV